MSDKSFTSIIKSDGEQVIYRQGAKKLSKAFQASVLSLASKAFNLDKKQLKVVKYMLTQPAGQAIVSWLIGIGLIKIPNIPQNEIIDNLAEEFRVTGMDMAADIGFEKAKDLFEENLLPFALQIFGALNSEGSSTTDIMKSIAEIKIPKNLRILDVEPDDNHEAEIEAMHEKEARKKRKKKKNKRNHV